ncbi:MAG TPA: hypothetical protein VFD30_04595 [Terriglobia bacterium]|nr:hypothetical protein [Terriglobia bacterium]
MSTENRLLRLAQDLEWLGCELEFHGHKHALEGFPESGPTWETFREKQRGVLLTCDKIEHELESAIRYNPASLVGMDFPLAATLDTITDLLAKVEDIKQAAVFQVHLLPDMVRAFTRLIEQYLASIGALAR